MIILFFLSEPPNDQTSFHLLVVQLSQKKKPILKHVHILSIYLLYSIHELMYNVHSYTFNKFFNYLYVNEYDNAYILIDNMWTYKYNITHIYI